MRDLDAILDAWRGCQTLDAVLATVVRISGSTYRSPGARMLIFRDGRRIGCVSGGCLDDDLVKKAWWLTESGAPVARIYDTMHEDDMDPEFGLGCNGVVELLLERTRTEATCAFLRQLSQARQQRTPLVAATIVRSVCPGVRSGDRLMMDHAGKMLGKLRGANAESRLRPVIEAVRMERKSRFADFGDLGAFVEWIGAPLSLVILGAGYDAVPLVNIATEMGWDVTIADPRPAYASPARFPHARRVVCLNTAGNAIDDLIDPDCAVVMMTHNAPLDLRLLPAIRRLEPRYLGILGPRARTEKLLRLLSMEPPEFAHYPAGLDIGSNDPHAIALSIAAEIQAELNARTGGRLRDCPSGVRGDRDSFATVDPVVMDYCGAFADG